MLPAPARLSRREDFALAVRRGRRVAGPGVVLHYASTTDASTTDVATSPAAIVPTAPARVGFVVGKTVGNAVTRNLVRRRLRHVMASRLDAVPSGARVVLRATPAATTRTFAELAGIVDDLLGRAFGQTT